MRQEDPDAYHSVQPSPRPPNTSVRFSSTPASLRLDAVGQRRQIIFGVIGDLAGEEHPAIALDRVAVWGHRLRRPCDHMKDGCWHDCPLAY